MILQNQCSLLPATCLRRRCHRRRRHHHHSYRSQDRAFLIRYHVNIKYFIQCDFVLATVSSVVLPLYVYIPSQSPHTYLISDKCCLHFAFESLTHRVGCCCCCVWLVYSSIFQSVDDSNRAIQHFQCFTHLYSFACSFVRSFVYSFAPYLSLCIFIKSA